MSLGRVSLTTDAWSDPNLVSFLGATAHFIVRDMLHDQLILRSGLLAFRHLQGSHTGEHLAEVFYAIIKGAGIERRVCWALCVSMLSGFLIFTLGWLNYRRQCKQQRHNDETSGNPVCERQYPIQSPWKSSPVSVSS